MTDHANELRRYSRKIGHPAEDVPSVMLAAADEIERLRASLEAAEKDVTLKERVIDALGSELNAVANERDALRTRRREMSNAFELEICQGKYRYRYEGGKQEVWRNGDTWPAMNEKLIGDKFVFSLAVELDEALKERDELRAKIAEMEKQEPVGKFTQHPSNGLWEQDGYGDNPDARPLYALPGAKGETK